MVGRCLKNNSAKLGKKRIIFIKDSLIPSSYQLEKHHNIERYKTIQIKTNMIFIPLDFEVLFVSIVFMVNINLANSWTNVDYGKYTNY